MLTGACPPNHGFDHESFKHIDADRQPEQEKYTSTKYIDADGKARSSMSAGRGENSMSSPNAEFVGKWRDKESGLWTMEHDSTSGKWSYTGENARWNKWGNAEKEKFKYSSLLAGQQINGIIYRSGGLIVYQGPGWIRINGKITPVAYVTQRCVSDQIF
eukprot:gnl/MRDRNA2_/MRDRNA2_119286_c0_seq1.p1 gnl/MRDRNA2_/MRDRNA2_119286_c0~~gnl/MRDRNA2_/MRDRNA2_119286_c0_seq1.p1  ORF type:complete len:159 (+),score=5.10 gnl/MRDRNA2_/MRDRNA2_119286_c0_seq1:129-605(+)